MKLRQKPEDFQVIELDDCEPGQSGPFAIYKLEKWDIGTIEAVSNVARKWNLPRAKFSFGGLKDRHARTEQLISIHGGPARDFEGSAFRLRHLGRARAPITRASFEANAFRIVVRDLETIPDLEPVREHGVPNYFDDQRFGSLRGTGGEFIGRALVRGEIEQALKLAIASPAHEDRHAGKKVKRMLAEKWGDWKTLLAQLPRSSERSIVHYLAEHPAWFGRAFELLDQNLRILYVSAYQSYLWNCLLAERIRKLPDIFEVPYRAGRHVFYRTCPDELKELTIPLLTPSQKFEGEEAASVGRLLAVEGIEQRMFRLKKLEKTFFGKGERDAVVAPRRLSAEAAPDDLHGGRRKWTLSFELPKGSYATLLIKRLFAAPIDLAQDVPADSSESTED